MKVWRLEGIGIHVVLAKIWTDEKPPLHDAPDPKVIEAVTQGQSKPGDEDSFGEDSPFTMREVPLLEITKRTVELPTVLTEEAPDPKVIEAVTQGQSKPGDEETFAPDTPAKDSGEDSPVTMRENQSKSGDEETFAPDSPAKDSAEDSPVTMREGQSKPGDEETFAPDSPAKDSAEDSPVTMREIQDLTAKLREFTDKVLPEAGICEQLIAALTGKEFSIVRLEILRQVQLKMAAPTEADLQSKLKGMKHAETKEAASLDPQMLEEQKPQDFLKVIEWACEENDEVARRIMKLQFGECLDSLQKPVQRRQRSKAPRRRLRRRGERARSVRPQFDYEAKLAEENFELRADIREGFYLVE